MRRFVIGITGASGVIYGVRLLQVLREMPDVQTHLILSRAARETLVLETEWAPEAVEALADRAYDPDDLAAPIASGSVPTAGMAIVPCSMKTLSAVAHSFAHNLIARAADVTLKEKRPLVLVPRETPLHKGHLELLAKAADLGAAIVPPMVAFYHRPTTIEEIVDHTVGKVLEQLDVEHQLYRRWQET
ncbi:UbiX family flavin prenyltransferase [Deferrisoma palaeochoriense]